MCASVQMYKYMCVCFKIDIEKRKSSPKACNNQKIK